MGEAESGLPIIQKTGESLTQDSQVEGDRDAERKLQLKKYLLIKVFSLAPECSLVTGSVALRFQEGVPIEEALAEAADLDILVRQNALSEDADRILNGLDALHFPLLNLHKFQNSFSPEALARSMEIKLGNQVIRLMHISDMLVEDVSNLTHFLNLGPKIIESFQPEIKKIVGKIKRILVKDWKGEINTDLLQRAKQLVGETESLRSKQ